MRDERDYASMGPQELREELVRATRELAAWSFSVARQRAEYHINFLEAYEASASRSVAERVKDAEMAYCRDRAEIMDGEGQVAFNVAIRDTIIELIRSVPPMMQFPSVWQDNNAAGSVPNVPGQGLTRIP